MDAMEILAGSGLLIIFGLLLLKESGIPIPVPGDLILIAAGIQAAQGRLELGPTLAVMLLAGLVGASIQFLIVRGPGRRLVRRYGRYAGLPPERLDRVSGSLRSRGARGVAVTRITPGVRAATAIAAGLAGVSYRSFLAGIAVGSLLWVLVHTLLGYFAGPVVLDALGSLRLPVLPLALAGLLLALVAWLLIARRRGRATALIALRDWTEAACPACLLAGVLDPNSGRSPAHSETPASALGTGA